MLFFISHPCVRSKVIDFISWFVDYINIHVPPCTCGKRRSSACTWLFVYEVTMCIHVHNYDLPLNRSGFPLWSLCLKKGLEFHSGLSRPSNGWENCHLVLKNIIHSITFIECQVMCIYYHDYYSETPFIALRSMKMIKVCFFK